MITFDHGGQVRGQVVLIHFLRFKYFKNYINMKNPKIPPKNWFRKINIFLFWKFWFFLHFHKFCKNAGRMPHKFSNLVKNMKSIKITKKVLKIRKWLTYDYYPKFKLLTKKFELYNQMRIDIYTIWEEVFSFVPSAVTQPFF